MEDIEFVYTIGMTDEELGEYLRESRAGVLSLADGGRAYGVPVSHYFDGSSLFFRLSDDDESRKLAFAATTEEASFTCFDAEAPGESWSVLAGGPLRELDESERAAFDPATLNRAFGELRVFDEATADVELRLFELDVERLTGRRTVG